MSLNLYSLILNIANEKNINITLEEMGIINNMINSLLKRNISLKWINNNLDCLIKEVI